MPTLRHRFIVVFTLLSVVATTRTAAAALMSPSALSPASAHFSTQAFNLSDVFFLHTLGLARFSAGVLKRIPRLRVEVRSAPILIQSGNGMPSAGVALPTLHFSIGKPETPSDADTLKAKMRSRWMTDLLSATRDGKELSFSEALELYKQYSPKWYLMAPDAEAVPVERLLPDRNHWNANAYLKIMEEALKPYQLPLYLLSPEELQTKMPPGITVSRTRGDYRRTENIALKRLFAEYPNTFAEAGWFDEFWAEELQKKRWKEGSMEQKLFQSAFIENKKNDAVAVDIGVTHRSRVVQLIRKMNAVLNRAGIGFYFRRWATLRGVPIDEMDIADLKLTPSSTELAVSLGFRQVGPLLQVLRDNPLSPLALARPWNKLRDEIEPMGILELVATPKAAPATAPLIEYKDKWAVRGLMKKFPSLFTRVSDVIAVLDKEGEIERWVDRPIEKAIFEAAFRKNKSKRAMIEEMEGLSYKGIERAMDSIFVVLRASAIENQIESLLRNGDNEEGAWAVPIQRLHLRSTLQKELLKANVTTIGHVWEIMDLGDRPEKIGPRAWRWLMEEISPMQNLMPYTPLVLTKELSISKTMRRLLQRSS